MHTSRLWLSRWFYNVRNKSFKKDLSDLEKLSCPDSHPYSYNNGWHCCKERKDSCQKNCKSVFLEFEDDEDCCPEEKRIACPKTERCADYFTGNHWKSINKSDFNCISVGCLERYIAYNGNDITPLHNTSETIESCEKMCKSEIMKFWSANTITLFALLN